MSDAFADKTDAIKDRFLASVPPRLTEITELVNLVRLGADGRATAQRLHALLQDICGTAGVLGVHDLARELAPAQVLTETRDSAGKSLSEDDLLVLRRCSAAAAALTIIPRDKAEDFPIA